MLGAVESGFVSRDNDDAAAANVFRIFQEANIPREQTALWNAIPWYSAPPFRKVDLKLGGQCLEAAIKLFCSVKAIVFAGKISKAVSEFVDTELPTYFTLSPGAQSRLTDPNFVDTITEDLRRIWIEIG